MDEKIGTKRCIICIDGAKKNLNLSNIERIRTSVKLGKFLDFTTGLQISQEVLFFDASPVLLGNKFGTSTATTDNLIRNVVFQTLKAILGVQHEIFIFASGQLGCFVARAVSGILHHMGNPKTTADLEVMFSTTLTLIKARQEDDGQRGGTALAYLRAQTTGAVNIKFMGLFDATKHSSSKNVYDISIVPTVQNFRHAMAFNEIRNNHALETPTTPATKDMADRTFLQAWFLGYHNDMTGGTQQDGLSLYPLQWIIIEAMLLGLVVVRPEKAKDNTLGLAFPQYAGGPPILNGSEKVRWQLSMVGGSTVYMFDLQATHGKEADAQGASHEIHFASVNPLYKSERKIFNKDRGLVGFDKEAPFGTIIHPSVFCIIDRTPRLLEQSRFKEYRDRLADFEVNNMRFDGADSAPWIESSDLLASGVKAFRILVCGKTGVGKSTLINKVFGVEMTEESNNYTQGVHDINQAFESPNHPGLLIHDSRGWQAGSDQELDLIAQFLRHRAFQKNSAEALHVIWFCVDSDVSRIEEADKRTFETIAQYSNHVPVFVVGTKKDKLVAFHKMPLLEKHMETMTNYQEASRLAQAEAEKMAQDQFLALKDQLSQIKAYKADGYVCLSKNDEQGVKSLLTQTLDMIVDDRVRLFCVAAQVVDVERKIDSAVSEVMRLSKHAVRTAMVPLPFSGMLGTPTVSRIICEHVLQCFGFPRSPPVEVEEIMKSIVMGNLKQFMTVSLTQFAAVAAFSVTAGVFTAGIGTVLGIAGSVISTPPTARMLLKTASDMILILERSFRYNGKFVSTKQIEDAAKQYVTINTTTFSGKEKRLQEHIHDEYDKMIPLKAVSTAWRFSQLRTGFEQIVYNNRFDRPPEYVANDPMAHRLSEVRTISSSATTTTMTTTMAELDTATSRRAELPGTSQVLELDGQASQLPSIAELPGSTVAGSSANDTTTSPTFGSGVSSPTSLSKSASAQVSELGASSSTSSRADRPTTRSNFFSRSFKSMSMKKSKTDG